MQVFHGPKALGNTNLEKSKQDFTLGIMALQEEVKICNSSQMCLVRTIFKEHSLEKVCLADSRFTGQAWVLWLQKEPT